jgi:hypothetical protein
VTGVVRRGTGPGGVPLYQTNRFGDSVYFPIKYGIPARTSQVIVASGIEAQLIQAEAAYHGATVPGGTAVDILNLLRRSTYPTELAPFPSNLSGDALLDTLFAERARWLFLSGHRQGDLRRLIRQYGRSEDRVYPNGGYPAVHDRFGSYVNLPIPESERSNPKFQGCLSRGA